MGDRFGDRLCNLAVDFSQIVDLLLRRSLSGTTAAFSGIASANDL
jgi:hypothetical protein